jgi:DNA-binding IclR family transcriptional regulator
MRRYRNQRLPVPNTSMTTVQNDAKTALRAPRRVQAVDHAVDVLECLARRGTPLGVTRIAQETGLSKATAHHLLATLEARSLVMRDADSPAYRLGWSLYELGSAVAHSVQLSRVARPFLDRLASDSGESVLLGILDDDSVLYLDRGDAPSGFHMVATAGRRSPLHATASGKLLLAFAPSEFVDRNLKAPLQAFTSGTLTDPVAVRDQLIQIRNQGYATCWQERELGLCSVAVPLRDHTGATVASLTLAGPAGRVTPESVEAHLIPLRAAAGEIEAQLGVNHVGGTEGEAQ